MDKEEIKELFLWGRPNYNSINNEYNVYIENKELIMATCLEDYHEKKAHVDETLFFKWASKISRQFFPIPFEIFKTIIDLNECPIGILNSLVFSMSFRKENNESVLYVFNKYKNHFHWFSEQLSENIIKHEHNFFDFFSHIFRINLSLLDYAMNNLDKDKMIKTIKKNEINTMSTNKDNHRYWSNSILTSIIKLNNTTNPSSHQASLKKINYFLELGGNVNQVLLNIKRYDNEHYDFFVISPLDLAKEVENNDIVNFLENYPAYDMLSFKKLFKLRNEHDCINYIKVIGDELNQTRQTFEEKYHFQKKFNTKQMDNECPELIKTHLPHVIEPTKDKKSKKI